MLFALLADVTSTHLQKLVQLTTGHNFGASSIKNKLWFGWCPLCAHSVSKVLANHVVHPGLTAKLFRGQKSINSQEPFEKNIERISLPEFQGANLHPPNLLIHQHSLRGNRCIEPLEIDVHVHYSWVSIYVLLSLVLIAGMVIVGFVDVSGVNKLISNLLLTASIPRMNFNSSLNKTTPQTRAPAGR